MDWTLLIDPEVHGMRRLRRGVLYVTNDPSIRIRNGVQTIKPKRYQSAVRSSAVGVFVFKPWKINWKNNAMRPDIVMDFVMTNF